MFHESRGEVPSQLFDLDVVPPAHSPARHDKPLEGSSEDIQATRSGLPGGLPNDAVGRARDPGADAGRERESWLPPTVAADEAQPVSEADLNAEYDKLDRDTQYVREMLEVAREVAEADARFGESLSAQFLDSLDFLQQCQPRLMDLVEAAVQGEPS